MKFIRFVKQTKKQIQYWSKTRTKKSNKQEKLKKAPRIEGINQKPSKNINCQCNNARERYQNILADTNQLLFPYTSNKLNTLFLIGVLCVCPSPSSVSTTVFCLSICSDILQWRRSQNNRIIMSSIYEQLWESKKWFGHKSSLITVHGVVDRAVAFGGRWLGALRANFHTSHLIFEA